MPSNPSRSFTVRGTRNGSLVTLTWQDGRLVGDYPTIDLIEVHVAIAEAASDDTRMAKYFADVGPGGGNALEDPVVAYRLIVAVLDTVRDVSGDPPEDVAATRQRVSR